MSGEPLFASSDKFDSSGGVPHTIEVVGDQASLLLSFVSRGLERFLVPRGERPDPAAFGLTFP